MNLSDFCLNCTLLDTVLTPEMFYPSCCTHSSLETKSPLGFLICVSLHWMCDNIASVLWSGIFWLWGMWDLSCLIRDRTCTPSTGRQGLNCWTTKEIPLPTLLVYFPPSWLKSVPHFDTSILVPLGSCEIQDVWSFVRFLATLLRKEPPGSWIGKDALVYTWVHPHITAP